MAGIEKSTNETQQGTTNETNHTNSVIGHRTKVILWISRDRMDLLFSAEGHELFIWGKWNWSPLPHDTYKNQFQVD